MVDGFNDTLAETGLVDMELVELVYLGKRERYICLGINSVG